MTNHQYYKNVCIICSTVRGHIEMRGGIFITLHTRNTLRERTVLRNVKCTPPPPILSPMHNTSFFLLFFPPFSTFLCYSILSLQLVFEFLVLKNQIKSKMSLLCISRIPLQGVRISLLFSEVKFLVPDWGIKSTLAQS